MKLKSLLALGLALVFSDATLLRGQGQKNLEKEPNLIHIPLTKTVFSDEEKGAKIAFVKMKQSYMYGDIDLDYDDFEAKEYTTKLDDKGVSTPIEPVSYGSNYGKNAVQVGEQVKNEAQTSSGLKTIPLYNFKNTQYTGQFALGSKDNTFDVIYDTGSANFWINSVQCQDKGCKNHRQYDGSRSSSYNKLGLSLDVEFGTGGLSGEINEDTVYFGGVEIQNQAFAEIVQEDGDVFAQSKFDGIVGLAYPTMAAYDESPVFDNIIKQKKLSSNVFTFYLDQDEGKSNSKITLGGVDKSLYSGNINYHKVTNEYYWEMKADNILVGGQDVGLCNGSKGCNVIADTGTSLLTGPSDDLYNLLETLNVDDNCKGVADLPTITFIMDGIHYDLNADEYVMSVTDNGVMEDYKDMDSYQRNNSQCAAAFMPLDIPEDQGPAWILGDVFLNKYYSIYDRDQGKVGFALAKH